MSEGHPDPAPSEQACCLLGTGGLPAPSSFMSSRWSFDNVVTCHPEHLYGGEVLEVIDPDALEHLVAEALEGLGAARVGAARMGVLTWDIALETERGPLTLQLPRVLDEPGGRGRAKRDVPGQCFQNARHFRAERLARFVVEPRELSTLGGRVPAALFGALPEHRRITIARGALRVELTEGKLLWQIGLGTGATAELLAEMVAALVYHYDPDEGGGTALTDVLVNDGDFVVRRRRDGSFDVRLTAARRREQGIGWSLLLLHLVQMMAFEDFQVDDSLTGLPLLASNPSVAFAGVVRGLRYRQRDLGLPEGDAEERAHRVIDAFGRSPEGRAYRPFCERFLEGRLPPSFGGDVREHWWRLVPLETRQRVLELAGRSDARAATSARTVRTFLDRLSREIGRGPDEDPALVRLNDLGRNELVGLLGEVGVEAGARPGVADEIFQHWPYRSFDHLLARAPGARPLRRQKSRLCFGEVVTEAEQSVLKSSPPAAKHVGVPRRFANAEIFGDLAFAAPLQAHAVQSFASFDAYMEAALHDSRWGYYAHGVRIGSTGHFHTHPEEFTPRYGGYVANMAFKAYVNMVVRGELAETDAFFVIEFGAGNGRLARDFLDAVARAAEGSRGADRERFRAFAARVEYRIYERSASLRENQRALLGGDALVAEGDARHPAETLKRDFPDGLRGFVVTNEVPDAFGVHKLALTAEGRAFAALVVPRVEPSARAALGESLWARVVETDRSLRAQFALRGHAGDAYLDREGHAAVMAALMGLPEREREPLRGALWFEEAYVPVSVLPELAAHLADNAEQYSIALAADDSGVVAYVNLHADRYVAELGRTLRAGFVVTIDYGDTTFGLVQGARRGDFPFRVYRDSPEGAPRPNDPYSAPGAQDLTADVNFTSLARAGEKAGLSLVHFGPERERLPGRPRGRAPRVPNATRAREAHRQPRVQAARARHACERPLRRSADDTPPAPRSRARRAEGAAGADRGDPRCPVGLRSLGLEREDEAEPHGVSGLFEQ